MKSSDFPPERWGGGTPIHDFYEDEKLRAELFAAWKRFSRGKLTQKKVRNFWLCLEENLFTVYHDIITMTYRHQSYEQFVIRDSKSRNISVASARDRVVHHYVSRHLSRVYQKQFYPHSYSSQAGKGTTAAREYVFEIIEALLKEGESVWIAKMDVRRYFENIDHAILLSALSRTVADQRIYWLCESIIKSFGTGGKGLPLGNLTSQWFGNIYLTELDWYVKRELKAKWYMRYNDDMLVICRTEEDAMSIVKKICAFVQERLHLEIPDDKIAIVNLPNPVDILGVVTDGSQQWLRKATRVRAERRLYRRIRSLHPQLLDSQCSYARIGVYDFSFL